MTTDEASIDARVEAALERIDQPEVVAALRRYLVSPRRCLLKWDYGHPHPEFSEPHYPGFMVVADSKSDTGIAFSEYGSGPSQPWVLTGLNEPRYGMDSSWFKTLEEAFRDSRLWEEPPTPP